MLKAEPNSINLSINPTYHCNLRCDFCYLTEQQLSDRKFVPVSRIKELLDDLLASGKQLGRVDLYGGEVLLLPTDYLQSLKRLLQDYGVKDIEIITNLTTYRPEIIEDREFGLSVSYDFANRQQHEHVWANMLKIQRPFTVLTLGTAGNVRGDHVAMIEQLNTLAMMEHWEIKPYSSNQANQHDVKFTDFEDLVRRVIEYPNKNFEFLNEISLKMAKFGDANPYSDDHVYITPSGKFAVLEFDESDNEYFLELDKFSDYLDWTILEKSRTLSNPFCGSCDYFGRCISEHLREVKSVDNSCNGFYKLIKWYETTK